MKMRRFRQYLRILLGIKPAPIQPVWDEPEDGFPPLYI